MKLKQLNAFAIFILMTSLLGGPTAFGAPSFQANTLPAQITDAEFWRMITEFSEPNGDYPYENFVSNEETIQKVIPILRRSTKPGGVYIGVGPEQNFTYAIALQAKMAFVIDIRRQNMIELLMYKTLFEMSPSRADFVSHLFSRKRPSGIDDKSTVRVLFATYDDVKSDAALYSETVQAIKSSLSKHGFKLSSDDLLKVDYILQVFMRAGPGLDYRYASASPPGLPQTVPNYEQFMTAADPEGNRWSFLASEENYQFVRQMNQKNLFIPVIGDFAGPSAIRNIGKYLKDRNAIVSAFYVSNVEYYLDAPKTQTFWKNAASLPVDSSSMFIRFLGVGQSANMPWWNSSMWLQTVASPMSDLFKQVNAGQIPAFNDMLRTIQNPLTPDLVLRGK